MFHLFSTAFEEADCSRSMRMAYGERSWVNFFMYLAFGVSLRSKDPVTQVGCVIVQSGTLKILSTGYNGFPPGIPNSPDKWSKEQKANLVNHAEANAIHLKGRAELKDAIMFITLFPCVDCAKKLIQVGIRKVYYLSFRDKYGESEKILKAAKVELVPVHRGDDGTLQTFEDGLTEKLKAVRPQQMTPQQMMSNEEYNKLWKATEKLRVNDIKSRWGIRSDEILFKKWADYFLFLAIVASTRSVNEHSPEYEGAVLINKDTLTICAIAYKGYPRFVDNCSDKQFIVSAISNLLCLRHCDGNHEEYAFSTHFPSLEQAKYLSQARVKRLYFISPTNFCAEALSILKETGVEVVPMVLLEEAKVQQQVNETIKGLRIKEVENIVSFNDWPTNQWTPYELVPKRRDAGLGQHDSSFTS